MHAKLLISGTAMALLLASGAAKAGEFVDVQPVSFLVYATYLTGPFMYCSSSGGPAGCSGSATGSSVTAVLGPNGGPYGGTASAAIGGSASATEITAVASALATQLEYDGPEASPFDFVSGGQLTYYFELTPVTAASLGPGPVPVAMAGLSLISAATAPFLSQYDSAAGSVSLQVSTADGSTVLYSLPTNNDGPYFQILQILPNVEYEVSLGAHAGAEVNASSQTSEQATASAAIDPTFTISPSCACANDYQLTFSPGINNGPSAAPEPATWAMMLMGFSGLGVAMRSRRKVSTAACSARRRTLAGEP